MNRATYACRLVACSLLLSSLLTEAATACSTCFGDPNSNMVLGAKAGVAVMAVIAYAVLGCVAWVGRGWYIRAKELAGQEAEADNPASNDD